MQQAVTARTPAHLWVVGILSLLWNCFGAYDYLMTRMHNMAYLSRTGDPNAILAWVASMPLYAQIGWALGVWGGLLGAVLLLMRSRYALWAFVASLIGMALSFGWQALAASAPGASNSAGMRYMMVFIILLGIGQAWYAWRQTRSGALR
jgi:hypothetical protein